MKIFLRIFLGKKRLFKYCKNALGCNWLFFFFQENFHVLFLNILLKSMGFGNPLGSCWAFGHSLIWKWIDVKSGLSKKIVGSLVLHDFPCKNKNFFLVVFKTFFFFFQKNSRISFVGKKAEEPLQLPTNKISVYKFLQGKKALQPFYSQMRFRYTRCICMFS